MKTLKNLLITAMLGLPCYVLGQNHEGNNDQIYYQESSGVYRIAKLDAVYAHDETIGFTTHDPEYTIQRRGERSWSPTTQWLKLLGTDGNIWQTRTHATKVEHGKYSIWMESERLNGQGNNPTFQFVDWDGNPWTVVKLAAKPLAKGHEDDHAPVYFILRKGK